MTAACRLFSKGFLVILGLTALLLLAGIIVLPALEPTYADPAQAQTSEDSSAVQETGQRPTQESTEFFTSKELYEINAVAN
jgi:hypothetical protein